MEEVHKYLDRFGWILTSYMVMETEGLVTNGWSRIVVFGLVFGAPRGELPVQTDSTRLLRAFTNFWQKLRSKKDF
jgi:hypothetical protein